MKTIFKYPLNPAKPVIRMPLGAQILTVREQGEQICVWARVHPDHPVSVDRLFSVYGTGHTADITPTTVFLGTAMLMGGSLVLHVFEETNP